MAVVVRAGQTSLSILTYLIHQQRFGSFSGRTIFKSPNMALFDSGTYSTLLFAPILMARIIMPTQNLAAAILGVLVVAGLMHKTAIQIVQTPQAMAAVAAADAVVGISFTSTRTFKIPTLFKFSLMQFFVF